VASRSVLIATDPVSGAQNRDVEFAEIAWAFFRSRLTASGSSAVAAPPTAAAIAAAEGLLGLDEPVSQRAVPRAAAGDLGHHTGAAP
jgi:hypothetical protein